MCPPVLSIMPRLGTKMREEDDLADRRHAGNQHHQPIDTDPQATTGREAVFERTHVVLIYTVRLFIACGRELGLRLEALELVDRVVELAECVAELAPEHDRFEPLDQIGILTVLSCE